jgi:Ca-activated chloride channel family protein
VAQELVVSALRFLGTIEVAVAVGALALIVALSAWRAAVRRRNARRWRMEREANGGGARVALDLRAVLVSAAALAVAVAAIVAAWQDDPGRRDAAPAPLAIVFAIDVSRSMEVSDVAPSRLEAARALVARVVAEAAPGAVGLVVFAGEAELTCPLTSDLDAVRMALDEIPAVAGTLAGGSAIGEALARSTASFGASRARKVVVLLTDGEDTGGSVEAATAKASGARVSVLAVGFGTANGTEMPVRRSAADDGVNAGRPVPARVTRLDAARLERVARATGGAYYAGAGQKTAADLVARLRGPATRISRAGSQGSLAAVLLGAAFACLAAEWLLGLAGRRAA